jgi:PPOX class probable F420-dependent enzyme
MANIADAIVQELLKGRHVATFGTLNDDGSIHMVAVWYVFDGGKIYIATASRSRKARNVKSRPQASLMIDSRGSWGAHGTTVSGTVRLLTGEESQCRNRQVVEQYLSPAAIADPRVGPVFAQWDDVTLELTPQSVFAWDMREADKAAFDSAFASHPDYVLPQEL